MIRLAGMFLVGFLGWGLVLCRSLALDTVRIDLLCAIIFLDDLLGVLVGLYLARVGTFEQAVVSGIACAAGGAFAAFALRKKIRLVKKGLVQ